jgi:hypothetical protein
MSTVDLFQTIRLQQTTARFPPREPLVWGVSWPREILDHTVSDQDHLSPSQQMSWQFKSLWSEAVLADSRMVLAAVILEVGLAEVSLMGKYL